MRGHRSCELLLPWREAYEVEFRPLPGGSCGKCEIGPQLVLVWENVFQSGFQSDQNSFEFVHREVVLTSLDAMQRGVRHANFLREIRIRKAAPRLSQIPRKLSVEVPLHARRLAKLS
jgi:hypothetical protein